MKKQKIMIGMGCCLALLLCLGIVVVGAIPNRKQMEETQAGIAVEEISIEEPATASAGENSISNNQTEDRSGEPTSLEENEETVVETQTEGETVVDEEPEESEYADFAIADVTNYVNVREEPNTDSEIVGKMYDGAVAKIVSVAGETQDWFQITSGNVEGYIKAEFFIYGQDAVAVMDEYVTRYVKVEADRLNVRPGASTEDARIGYIDHGEKVKLLEDCGEWLRIQYTAGKEGYVAAQYVTIQEEYVYAKTLEEEHKEQEALRELQEREKEKEEKVPEVVTNVSAPEITYTSNAELRQSIVNYALQYVGYPYVSGGRSLATGTDCSGFTCFVYADFGYAISRTPGGQLSGSGRSIEYRSIQPGDIICYSSNGGASCTHVGLYIGNGQIVHAANSRKGVITQNADYDLIIGVKNVID